MAWSNNYNDDTGKVSEFNPAALKMKRLDRALTILNEIRGNLLAFNQEYGVYNYELTFQYCNVLYLEVESKLKPSERKKGEALKLALKKLLENNPVYETKHRKVYPHNKIMKLNGINWKVIEKWLFEYDTLVRKLLDEHGMDTKYKDIDEDEDQTL